MSQITRRDFTRWLTVGGATALLPGVPGWGRMEHRRSALRAAGNSPGEGYWQDVRQHFLMPPDRVHMNAANLCPAPRQVIEVHERWTRAMDADPSVATKSTLADAREETRRVLAEFIGATPEGVVITRNTSEANNFVSSGLTLGPDDHIVLFSDNHASNLAAWREKTKRFGFAITVVPQANPHPGADYYVEAFSRAITARTRLLAFTHVTNSVGDMLPARELCALARERGILSLVDGAQSFGVLAVNMAEMQPDFYTGSAHKWPCGPKETGLLYVRRDAYERLTPSVTSLYAGRVGASRTLEAMGQRDEAGLAALAEALRFQMTIGRSAVEDRSRELTQMLMSGLAKLPGVTFWTSGDPGRRGAVVTFKPAGLDPRRLAAALYERDRIACAARAGEDRPGIRLSAHFYNPAAEVERAVAAVRGYLRTGI